MPDYREDLIEDLRLLILRILHELKENRASSSVLETAVYRWGQDANRDQIETEIDYLAKLGAVTVERLEQGGEVRAVVATLTDRGERHVQRRETIAGVKRPSRS